MSIKVVVFVILLYFCSACRGRNGKEVGDKIVVADSIQADTVHKLEGLWVNKVYADTLLLTCSPRASQRVGGNTYLYFTDSTEPSVLVGWGFHEGTAWSIIRNSNKVMLYDSGEKRNMGVVETISTEEFRLGREDFIKLKHPNRNNYDYDIVEELLFAGNYRMQNGASVSLSPDGQVSGWDTIRYYVPNVDYIGPGLDVDQVELGSNKDKLTPYGFRFDKDTLFIYKLNCLIPDISNMTATVWHLARWRGNWSKSDSILFYDKPALVAGLFVFERTALFDLIFTLFP